MPASREINIVAIARPRLWSPLKSTVQAESTGERMPIATPKNAAPVRNIATDSAKPVRIIAMIRIMPPDYCDGHATMAVGYFTGKKPYHDRRDCKHHEVQPAVLQAQVIAEIRCDRSNCAESKIAEKCNECRTEHVGFENVPSGNLK